MIMWMMIMTMKGIVKRAVRMIIKVARTIKTMKMMINSRGRR